MSEHLDTQQFAMRTAYVLLDYGAMHLANLLQTQFASQHDHIRPLGKEFRRFAVRHVALRRYMHLDARMEGIEYRRKVGGYDGIDALGTRPIHNRVHQCEFVVVDDGIDRQVGLDTALVGYGYNLRHVVERKVGCRLRPHVELSDAEIDRIGTRIDGCPQRFVTPHRSHYLYVAAFH